MSFTGGKIQSGSGGSSAGVVGSTQVIIAKTVYGDGIIGSVPAGYVIEIINSMETAGVAVELNYSLTNAYLKEILAGIAVPPKGSDITGMLYNPNANETGFNIYVSNNLAWGAANVDIYIILRKIK